MFSDSHFHPVKARQHPSVTIWVNGQSLTVPGGWSLAAALLASGITASRKNAADGQLRGPYCMMGVCFECRVTVDDEPNVQACMTTVKAGMQVTLNVQPELP